MKTSAALRVALLAVGTAAIVTLARGGDAVWLSVPVALLACAWSQTRTSAAWSAAAIIVCAAVPELLWEQIRPLPSPLLVALVPGASVAVLIAVRERLERELDGLRHFALSDPLTGVANRRALLARIEYEIARHTRAQRSFAVLMLDLDGFKGLNDRFGHAAGDDLLRDVAAALERAVRGQDTVARLGGDEFCVLAPETDVPGAQALTKRVADAVSDVTAGVETLHASSGVALFPADGVAASSLMNAADQRLLRAKRERPHALAARRAA